MIGFGISLPLLIRRNLFLLRGPARECGLSAPVTCAACRRVGKAPDWLSNVSKASVTR
jgi:hypothetical protein